MKKWLIGLLVLLAIVAVLAYAMSWNLKRITINTYNQDLVKAPYDVIIVPGIPYDTANSNILLKVRIFWAKNLLDKEIAKNIIFSGAAVHTPWVEGKVMKILADSLGISSLNTFTEDKAEHGNENVYYSYKLAKQLGFKKIALATDQYQNAFLTSFIEARTADVAQLPVIIDSFPVYEKKTLPIIDAHEAFATKFVPLKERESRWERFRSSFSKDVK
jgi:hypothetical protein